jgi:hypothetical protein
LESLGLSVEKLTYQPDIALNAVLESRLANKKLLPGQPIAKGTAVELIVGMPDREETNYDSIGISR